VLHNFSPLVEFTKSLSFTTNLVEALLKHLLGLQETIVCSAIAVHEPRQLSDTVTHCRPNPAFSKHSQCHCWRSLPCL